MSNDDEDRSVPVVLPAIRIAPLGELRFWIISEDELKQFEQGSPAGLYLNFSLTLVSMGLSFLITLLSTPISSDRTFAVFVIVTVLSMISGLVLLALWYRDHCKLTKLADTIRKRMPPAPGVPLTLD